MILKCLQNIGENIFLKKLRVYISILKYPAFRTYLFKKERTVVLREMTQWVLPEDP